jgi:hypothetical protein
VDGDHWLATVFTPLLARESLAHTKDAEILRGQLCALHDCEVLDDRVFADALARLDGAIDAARGSAALSMISSDDAHPVPEVVLPEPIALLRRVVAVGAGLAVVDGMPVIVTSVELWDNRVYVFVAGLSTAETERRHQQHDDDFNAWLRERRAGRSGPGTLGPPEPWGIDAGHFRLHDDVGTEYRFISGSSGGSRRSDWRLEAAYTPGVPDAATRLRLEFGDGRSQVVRLDIPLRG